MFLHFGPGGNASLERLWLNALEDKIDFWDQPALSGDNCSFESLVQLSLQKYNSKNFDGLVAHSFGCDIARFLIGKVKTPIKELILVSPIRDIPTAFLALAENLSIRTESLDLKRSILNRSRNADKISAVEIAAFWKTVQAITVNPKFPDCYWGNPKKLNQFKEISNQLPALDSQMWQVVLNDFFAHEHHNQMPNCKTTVILGDKDPYFQNLELEKKYWQQSGARVVVAPDSGHYPHLESSILSELLK